MSDVIAQIRKALVAALVAGLAALGAAMLDGTLTQSEAIVSAGMALAGLAATYTIPNRRPARDH